MFHRSARVQKKRKNTVGQVRFKDIWAHTLEWIEKESIGLINKFLTIDLSMKYKREIHLNFDVPWWLLSESLVHIFTALYQFFSKIVLRNIFWKKLSSLLDWVFWEISCQWLITSPYLWKWWVSINYNERYIVDNKTVLKNYETFVFWPAKVSYKLIKFLQEMLNMQNFWTPFS